MDAREFVANTPQGSDINNAVVHYKNFNVFQFLNFDVKFKTGQYKFRFRISHKTQRLAAFYKTRP